MKVISKVFAIAVLGGAIVLSGCGASNTVKGGGIGAGAGCDGQVLVYQDMTGMYGGHSPKFAKKFVDIGEHMKAAFGQYIQQTKSGEFPALEHTFTIDDEIIEKLKQRILG